MFGEEEDDEDDPYGSQDNDTIISALSFDRSGRFLAVGDHSGQVVILSQQEDKTYQLYSEFKSHDPAFDCLTSVEIEEKINMLRWYPYNTSRVQHLLTTNDKTIKLFKIWEKSVADGSRFDVLVKPRKIYDSGHAYNINSLSFNTDGETFISTDDLRINLWNLEVSKTVFVIVDVKPDNMDELSEIITNSVFHPINCNLLAYSTSKGALRFCDLRAKALCQNHVKEFEDVDSDIGGFFHELVSNISDIKFSPNGQFIVSRDYLTMKVWDSRMERKPLRVIQFQDHIVPKLCDLYENNCIFDKFECSWDSNSSRLVTGSYNNNFYVCDAFSNKVTPMNASRPNANTGGGFFGGNRIQFSQKVTHASFHPTQDIVTLGAKDFGYLYVMKEKQL
jgi:serine/threonine-protein phosphatase 2A regulatory subunit B